MVPVFASTRASRTVPFIRVSSVPSCPATGSAAVNGPRESLVLPHVLQNRHDGVGGDVVVAREARPVVHHDRVVRHAPRGQRVPHHHAPGRGAARAAGFPAERLQQRLRVEVLTDFHEIAGEHGERRGLVSRDQAAVRGRDWLAQLIDVPAAAVHGNPARGQRQPKRLDEESRRVVNRRGAESVRAARGDRAPNRQPRAARQAQQIQICRGARGSRPRLVHELKLMPGGRQVNRGGLARFPRRRGCAA